MTIGPLDEHHLRIWKALSLAVLAVLPWLDFQIGGFRGLVGYYAVHTVGLSSAAFLCVLAGVLAWIVVPASRFGVYASSAAIVVCLAVCTNAVAMRSTDTAIHSLPFSGETSYVLMMTSTAFGLMGLLSSLRTMLSTRKTIFLSSTTADLQAHRDVVYSAIEGLEGFSCIRMEEFGGRNSSPVSFIRQRVAACDIFIGIIGTLYGSCPPDSQMSFTEIEFDQAVRKRKKCLMFLSDTTIIPAAGPQEDPSKQERLRQLRNRISAAYVRASFSSPDNLAKAVLQALRNLEHDSI